jgi:hypothetical protein
LGGWPHLRNKRVSDFSTKGNVIWPASRFLLQLFLVFPNDFIEQFAEPVAPIATSKIWSHRLEAS